MYHYWTGIQPISFASLSRCKLGLWKFVLLQMKSLICLCITSRVMVRWKSIAYVKVSKRSAAYDGVIGFMFFLYLLTKIFRCILKPKCATTPRTPVNTAKTANLRKRWGISCAKLMMSADRLLFLLPLLSNYHYIKFFLCWTDIYTSLVIL